MADQLDVILPDDKRAQLDGIVSQMTANGESDDTVRAVVEDFKQKYGAVRPSGPQMNFALVNGVRVPVDAQGQPVTPVETRPTGGLFNTALNAAEDAVVGAWKGAGNTAYGLGKIVHDYTPIGRISEAIQPGAFAPQNKPPELTPTNTAQKVGYAGEQLGEFLLPIGDAAKVGTVAEMGRGGVLGLAQTGSPTTAAISAAIPGVLPAASLIPGASKVADALQESAEKTMTQALGATKEWAKAQAAKLAPQMLQRGIGGTRSAMLDLASSMAQKVGANLEAAYTTAAQAGQTVPSNIIAGNIQAAGDALKIVGPSGTHVAIPGTERVLSRLDDLATWVQSLGPDIPVDKAAQIKRTWDTIVSKAGLFGPKAAASATDAADAWAFREASNAFRQLLNTNPTLEALNKESSFWIGLRKVLTATQLRTQAQRGGLIDAIRGAAGAAGGAALGGPGGAAVGNVLSEQWSKLLVSPWWKSQVSAPFKAMLADALASGSPGRVLSVLTRIGTAIPSQVQQGLAQHP